MNFIIRLLGLKGSWKWAVRHMKSGGMVRPSNITGAVVYKLDDENQGRIVWAFVRNPNDGTKWESASIFVSDFKRQWNAA